MVSELVSASLDYYRDVATPRRGYVLPDLWRSRSRPIWPTGTRRRRNGWRPPATRDELPFVRDALASIADGGYTEAITRAAHLLGRHGEPLPLERLQLKEELLHEYRDLLPDIPRDEARRIRGEQEIICRYEPERAITSLPTLLREPEDRQRLVTLLERLLADPRIQAAGVTDAQRKMLARIHGVLGEEPAKLIPTQPKRRARKAPSPSGKSRT